MDTHFQKELQELKEDSPPPHWLLPLHLTASIKRGKFRFVILNKLETSEEAGKCRMWATKGELYGNHIA